MQDYNLGPSVSVEAVGDKYDSTATYAVGDYCIYDDKLYKCNTAISTAEAWNASHWTDTTIAEVLQTIPVVVDNLTTNDGTKALSAAQGKTLNSNLANLETLISDSSALTASTNVTISAQTVLKVGRIVEIFANITYTGTYTSGAAYIELATINKAKFFPYLNLITIQEDNSSIAEAWGSSCMMSVSTIGQIKVYKPSNSNIGKQFIIHLVFISAS